jgi:anti-sigma B factor antagonist
MAISVEIVHSGRALVLKVLADSLETDNVAAFRSAITPMLDKSAHFVIDLSDVEFMDSTGLGSMLSCLRIVKSKGGSLRLCNLTPEVEQLFEMVMMDRVFEIFPTTEAALAK